MFDDGNEGWDFFNDPKAMNAIRNAAVMFVQAKLGKAVSINSDDDDFLDACHDGMMYLQKRPSWYEKAKETGHWVKFTNHIYTNALLRPWETATGARINHQESKDIAAVELSKVERKPSCPMTYDADQVQELVALAWFPEMVNDWNDPFARRQQHPLDSFWIKSKADPSKGNTGLAMLADMHRALRWNGEPLQEVAKKIRANGVEVTPARVWLMVRDGMYNPAGLTGQELQAVFLRYALDLTEVECSNILGSPRATVGRIARSGIDKLVDHMNNVKEIR